MRFQRLIRDLTVDLGKKVEFTTEGGDTELDKNIIEKIVDPLMHILRNSMDHGIEMPKKRLKAGKAETGSLKSPQEEHAVFPFCCKQIECSANCSKNQFEGR